MNYKFKDLKNQYQPFSLTIEFHNKKEIAQFRTILYNHFHTGLCGQLENATYWDEIMEQLYERYENEVLK